MKIARAVGKKLSHVLANNPKFLFFVQNTWLEIGHKVLDLRMADWVIRRPEWLRVNPRLTHVQLESEHISEPSSLDIELADRIISQHSKQLEKSKNDSIPSDSIWGVLLQTHFESLSSLVERGNAAVLANYLSKLFRTVAVNGFTYGTTFDSWPHRWNYLPVQIELSVVQLAECVGLIRAECHEQGVTAFWRTLMTEEVLISKLEDFFGFRIEQPRSGDPRGILFGGRFLTRETCSHLHSAYKIAAAIDKSRDADDINIVEIGGGFGGTCYWLHKILGKRIRNYTIVDLPEVGLVQAYFLGKWSPENLVLYGESHRGLDWKITLLPHTRIDEIDFKPNVVINQDSMPEMPIEEVKRYLHWISRNLDGLFISFNQETLSNASRHELQVYVPELVSKLTKLRRISRETSWDRRGYVEEVYTSNSK